jgi:hypothetical protein
MPTPRDGARVLDSLFFCARTNKKLSTLLFFSKKIKANNVSFSFQDFSH